MLMNWNEFSNHVLTESYSSYFLSWTTKTWFSMGLFLGKNQSTLWTFHKLFLLWTDSTCLLTFESNLNVQGKYHICTAFPNHELLQYVVLCWNCKIINKKCLRNLICTVCKWAFQRNFHEQSWQDKLFLYINIQSNLSPVE